MMIVRGVFSNGRVLLGRRSPADDRGSATLELAVLALPLLLVLGLAIYAGRISIAHAALDQAARDAARSASLAPDADAARTAARAAAKATLSDQGLTCSEEPKVDVDTSEFDAPAGQPAVVSVHVSCDLSLSDLSLPGVRGTMALSADMTSPLDEFRSRKPVSP